MTAQQVLLILWARRMLILVVLPLTVAVTLIVSLLTPKQYAAAVSIVVDVKADPIIGAVLPALASPSYMMTQTEIIQSERVAMRAVKLLHLDQSPPAVEKWTRSSSSRVPFDYYYGGLLLKGLVVQPFKGSNVIVLTYTGQDPQFAAAVANAFAQAYIETNIELRVEPARQYAAWFDERQKSLREALEKAQARLSAYQQEKGIVASDERLDQETGRLTSLSAQVAQIQGQRVESSSRQKNSGSELSPDVQQNPLIQNLKAELSKAEASLSEISSAVGSKYPKRLQLEAQIDGLKRQIAEETQRISGGAATAARTTAQMEDQLQALIETQKKKVLDLRAQRDQIAVLTNDVTAAQRAYESVAQRMSQLSLESKSEQSNLSVLSPAVAPTDPSRPKVMTNVLAALAGGLALGIGLAIGLESLDRRVRNGADLKAAEGVPLLGVLAAEGAPATLRGWLALAIRHMRNSRRRGGRGAGWKWLPRLGRRPALAVDAAEW